jgi:hypothetical protein
MARTTPVRGTRVTRGEVNPGEVTGSRTCGSRRAGECSNTPCSDLSSLFNLESELANQFEELHWRDDLCKTSHGALIASAVAAFARPRRSKTLAPF